MVTLRGAGIERALISLKFREKPRNTVIYQAAQAAARPWLLQVEAFDG